MLDGIAQGGARNSGVVAFEEGEEASAVFDSSFAEHPSDGFVHEVVFVSEEGFGEAECVVELSGADEGECGDDGDASLPEVS